jgi:hypothetical protein
MKLPPADMPLPQLSVSEGEQSGIVSKEEVIIANLMLAKTLEDLIAEKTSLKCLSNVTPYPKAGSRAAVS